MPVESMPSITPLMCPPLSKALESNGDDWRNTPLGRSLVVTNGAEVFQLPNTIQEGTVISVTMSKPATVVVCFDPRDSEPRDGGFPQTLPSAEGWTSAGVMPVMYGSTTWGDAARPIEFQCWEFSINVMDGGTAALPATTTEDTSMVIAVQRSAIPSEPGCYT